MNPGNTYCEAFQFYTTIGTSQATGISVPSGRVHFTCGNIKKIARDLRT